MNEHDSYIFLERFGKPGGGKGILVSTNFCPTLTSQQLTVCTEECRMKDDTVVYENHPNDSRVKESIGVCPTLSSRMGTGGGNVHLLSENTGERYVVRRITPKECERLQGFPDGYTDIPWPKSDHAPDSHRYKALGNSMAVPVMRWIGKRIETALSNPITEYTSEPVCWQPELF